mgnify:CR=1 FL=1
MKELNVENSCLKLYAINPFSKKKTPIFLKSDDDFGHLNENGEPYVDSKLGFYLFFFIMFTIK